MNCWLFHKQITICRKGLDVILLGIYETAAESAEQDQTARMCRLILLFTHRKDKFRIPNGRIRVYKGHSKSECERAMLWQTEVT